MNKQTAIIDIKYLYNKIDDLGKFKGKASMRRNLSEKMSFIRRYKCEYGNLLNLLVKESEKIYERARELDEIVEFNKKAN